MDFGTKNIQVSIQQYPRHTKLKLTWNYDFDEICLVADAVLGICQKAGKQFALVDAHEVVGAVPNLDRFYLGKRVAEVWGGKIKAALVVEGATINRLFENTAVNRYARVALFADEETALDWLFNN